MIKYFLNKNGYTTASLTRQNLIEQFLSEGITIDKDGKEYGERTWHEITETDYLSRQPKEVEPTPPTYEQLVEQKIRTKYSVSDELGILRQRDTKPKEFDEYNAYCEKCKAEARREL